MKAGYWIMAIAIILLFVLAIAPARAHQTAAAEGIPDYVYLSGCCSKNDCKAFEYDAIELTEEGFRFKVPDGHNTQFNIKYEDTQDSPDGKYWGCFIQPGKSCLEYSKESNSHYGPGCLRYAEKNAPWKLRKSGPKWCFWKPVNV